MEGEWRERLEELRNRHMGGREGTKKKQCVTAWREGGGLKFKAEQLHVEGTVISKTEAYIQHGRRGQGSKRCGTESLWKRKGGSKGSTLCSMGGSGEEMNKENI